MANVFKFVPFMWFEHKPGLVTQNVEQVTLILPSSKKTSCDVFLLVSNLAKTHIPNDLSITPTLIGLGPDGHRIKTLDRSVKFLVQMAVFMVLVCVL